APTAPRFSASRIESELLAHATIWCPPARSLCTMLPPMRPRPTNPSFMTSPSGRSKRGGYGVVERLQAAGDVRREVDAGSAPSAPVARRTGAGALSRHALPEAPRPARDRHPPRGGRRDLQEHPGARAALVELAGRMEKARPEPERRGHRLRVADAQPYRVQR